MSTPQDHGDLPQHARERLAEMRQRKLFTSDLSVNEFLLVKEAGFDPLGLVMGSSIYRITPTIPSSVPKGQPGCELTDMTRALYHARDLAMTRMEEEADELGADGILGVRLVVNLNTDPQRAAWDQYKDYQEWALSVGYTRQSTTFGANWASQWQRRAWDQWNAHCQRMGWAQQAPPWARPRGQAMYALGQNVAEFLAIGTAVRHRAGGNYRNARGKPFQSDLSGQDFWLLLRAGYRPVGFVMGNCVYYVPPRLLQMRSGTSDELHEYTHALYDARELAMERIQGEAEALGATGIVGVTVSEQEHAFRTRYWDAGNAALQTGELLELFVIGTAVVPVEGGAAPLRPELVIVANDAPSAAPAGEGE